MQKVKNDPDVKRENSIITYSLIQGGMLKQIACKLHCSRSAAHYKIKKLFELFEVKDRYQYVAKIFTNIIEKHLKRIDKLEAENEKLKEELAEYKALQEKK